MPEHEISNAEPNWETAIVCTCGERCRSRHEFLEHRGDAYKDEIEELRSFDGILRFIDEVYPAEVFTGVSGDPGPRIIVLLREIQRLQKAHDTAEAVAIAKALYLEDHRMATEIKQLETQIDAWGIPDPR